MEIYFKAGKVAIGNYYLSPLLEESSRIANNKAYPQISGVLRLNYEPVGSKNFTPFVNLVCAFCLRNHLYHEVIYSYDEWTKERVPQIMYSDKDKSTIIKYLMSKGYHWDA